MACGPQSWSTAISTAPQPQVMLDFGNGGGGLGMRFHREGSPGESQKCCRSLAQLRRRGAQKSCRFKHNPKQRRRNWEEIGFSTTASNPQAEIVLFLACARVRACVRVCVWDGTPFLFQNMLHAACNHECSAGCIWATYATTLMSLFSSFTHCKCCFASCTDN